MDTLCLVFVLVGTNSISVFFGLVLRGVDFCFCGDSLCLDKFIRESIYVFAVTYSAGSLFLFFVGIVFALISFAGSRFMFLRRVTLDSCLVAGS